MTSPTHQMELALRMPKEVRRSSSGLRERTVCKLWIEAGLHAMHYFFKDLSRLWGYSRR